MTTNRCINCNAPDADPYDLMVRSNTHDDVYLCATCYEAIQREMAEGP